MFNTGDKVVHPGYGPGVITGIERREMMGEEKQYYVIELLAGGGTLMTPVANASEIGLRPAISKTAAKRLLESLTEEPGHLPNDFRERQTDVEERLKDGDIHETISVIRDLAEYERNNGLTKRDTQLMQQAEELVAGEVALVRDVEIKEALTEIQNVVEKAVRERMDPDA